MKDATRRMVTSGNVGDSQRIVWKDRTKFVAIDIGSSGAWLVEKSTGELFNIMGYGQPDKNKKRKANIGNIYTVDAGRLRSMRYNYLTR